MLLRNDRNVSSRRTLVFLCLTLSGFHVIILLTYIKRMDEEKAASDPSQRAAGWCEAGWAETVYWPRSGRSERILSRTDGTCPLTRDAVVRPQMRGPCFWGQKEWYRKVFMHVKALSLCYAGDRASFYYYDYQGEHSYDGYQQVQCRLLPGPRQPL